MNVIIYVMDALREDRLGCYGFEKSTSPNIDDFAEDAVQYTNAYSVATWTKPNAAALLTGRHPRALDMMHHTDAVPEVDDDLPSLLSQLGFETVAISANTFVTPEFGFDNFDRFADLQKDPAVQQRRKQPKEEFDEPFLQTHDLDEFIVPHSEDINEKAFNILSDNRERFTLLWSIDTHGPYYLRDGKGRLNGDTTAYILEEEVDESNINTVRDLYEEMVRYNDEQFGALVDHLKAEGIYDESILVLMADHGESLGERQTVTGRPVVGHNHVVYEELIHIPLLVKYPKSKHGGTTDNRIAQIVDVLPTLLNVVSWESDNGHHFSETGIIGKQSGGDYGRKGQGRSLVPTNDVNPNRSILIESQPQPKGLYSAAVRRDQFKLLKIERDLQFSFNWKALVVSALQKLKIDSPQLYDLERDPAEMDDIAESRPTLTSELHEILDEIVAAYDEMAGMVEGHQADLEKSTQKRLENLGYR